MSVKIEVSRVSTQGPEWKAFTPNRFDPRTMGMRRGVLLHSVKGSKNNRRKASVDIITFEDRRLVVLNAGHTYQIEVEYGSVGRRLTIEAPGKAPTLLPLDDGATIVAVEVDGKPIDVTEHEDPAAAE